MPTETSQVDLSEFDSAQLTWAWRVVRPDFRSQNDFRWPFPGQWAKARGPFTKGSACATVDGDGLHLAKDFVGAAQGSIPLQVALYCGYYPDDVLGEDAHKVRVKRAFVAEVIDLWREVREGQLADLSGADLSGADLYGADLSGANLYGADLSRANLSRADLSRANLSRANLSRANLYGADLSRANLSGANLYGANLSGANLSRADLSRANLSRANLYGANLSRANLSRANLSRADLYGAYRPADPPAGWKANESGFLVKS